MALNQAEAGPGDPGPYQPFDHGRRPLLEVSERMIIIKRTPAGNAALHFTLRPPVHPPKEPLSVEDQIAREESNLSELEGLINEYRAILDLLQSNVSFKKAVHVANTALEAAVADKSISPQRYDEIKSSIKDDFSQPVPSRVEAYNVTIVNHSSSYDDYLDFGDLLTAPRKHHGEAPAHARQPTAPPTNNRGPPPPVTAHPSAPTIDRPEVKTYASAATAQHQPDGHRPANDKQARSAKRRSKITTEYAQHQDWAAGYVGNHFELLPNGGGARFDLESFRTQVDRSAPPKFRERPASNVMHIVGLPEELTNKEMTGLVAELAGRRPVDIMRPRRTGEAQVPKPKGCYVLFSSPGRCLDAISTIRSIGVLNDTKLHCGLAQPARSPRWQRLQLQAARTGAADCIAHSITRIRPDCQVADSIGEIRTRSADLDQLWRIIDAPSWWDEGQVDEAIAEFTKGEHPATTTHTDEGQATEAQSHLPAATPPGQQPITNLVAPVPAADTDLSQDQLYQNLAALHEPDPITVQPVDNEGHGPVQSHRAGADADIVVLVADSQASPTNSQPATGSRAPQGSASGPSSSADYASTAPSTDLAQQRHNLLGTPSDRSEAASTTLESSGMGTPSGPTPPSVSPPKRGFSISTPASLAANLVSALASTTIPRSPASRRKQQDSSPAQAGAKKPRLAIPASQESPSSPPGSDPTPGPAKSQ